MTPAVRARRVLLMGLFVLAGAIVAQVVVSEFFYADTGIRVSRIVSSVVSALVTAGYVAGASLIAGSVVIRELASDKHQDQVER